MTPILGRGPAGTPSTFLELLGQPHLAPINLGPDAALVTIAELPGADAGRAYDALMEHAAVLYDQVLTEVMTEMIARGMTGSAVVPDQHPRDWLAEAPMMRALAAHAERGGPVRFDQSELDHAAAELYRTEGTPRMINGEIVQEDR